MCTINTRLFTVEGERKVKMERLSHMFPLFRLCKNVGSRRAAFTPRKFDCLPNGRNFRLRFVKSGSILHQSIYSCGVLWHKCGLAHGKGRWWSRVQSEDNERSEKYGRNHKFGRIKFSLHYTYLVSFYEVASLRNCQKDKNT